MHQHLHRNPLKTRCPPNAKIFRQIEAKSAKSSGYSAKLAALSRMPFKTKTSRGIPVVKENVLRAVLNCALNRMLRTEVRTAA